MSDNILALLLDAPWIVFLAYWIIKATKTRETREAESPVSRYLVMLVLVAGYLLIFGKLGRFGMLGKRFVPGAMSVVVPAIATIWLGIGLAIWARHHLAENWSARVTIKQGHELIRTGPYARLRHPIYSGLLLATLGTAVAIGKWGCLVGTGLILLAYSFKAKREEAMLTRQFGEKFQEHCRHTGFLLPRFR